MISSKKNGPLISIIIPIYNSEKYLEECLNSVINQTLKNIEIICVNDGSTDNSLEILKSYAKKDDRIIILDETNHGAGISREKGLNISKGKYIYFADSDDILEKNLCELTYKNAIANKSDITFFKIKYFNSKTQYEYIPEKFDLSRFFDENTNFNKFIFDYNDIKSVVFNDFTSIWNCLYKSELLKKNNIYFPEKLSFNDVPLHVQSIILAKRLSFVPSVLYNYRLVNENSITTTSHKSKKVFDIFEISDFLEKFLIETQLLNQFHNEFINFKLTHYIYHFNNIKDDNLYESFFNKLKLEFKNMNITKTIFNQISDEFKSTFLSIIDSSTFSEFQIRKQKYHHNIRDFDEFPNMIKISIIIPVYNVECYIDECLNSVLNQSLKDIEIICVNDGSTDNSLNILNSFAKKDSRIKIFNQKNCGLGCARNTGLINAKGEYLLFLDSDDYLSAGGLEKLYNNALDNESELTLFKIARFNDSYIDYSNPAFPLDRYFNKKNFNDFTFSYKDIKNYVLTSSFSACLKLYKKEFLDKFQDLKFPVGTAYEDVIFHVKCLLRASKMSFLPEYIYNYRISNLNSIMHTSSNTFDILNVCNSVELFLTEENYLNEFKLELIHFKIIQLSQFITLSNSKEYFDLVKSEFEKMNFNEKEVYPHLLERYKTIVSSETLEKYLENIKSNENKTQISVIIPVYNTEKYVSQCLDSIINQTLKNLEVICIDDGSTDNSLKILLNWLNKDSRIKVLSKKNGGAGSARNIGLNLSKGEYIYFIDSDDWISNETLEETYTLSKKYNLDMLMFLLINYDDTTGKLYETDYYNLSCIPSELDEVIFDYNDVSQTLFNIAVSPCNKLIKKELYDKTGFRFNEDVMYEDNPFFFKMIINSEKISVIRKHYYYRRRRKGSVMTLDGEKLLDILPMTTEVINIFKEEGILNKYAVGLTNYKIIAVRNSYTSVNSNVKALFFREMKTDFLKIKSDKKLYELFKKNLYQHTRQFLENTIKSNSYQELNGLMEIFNKEKKIIDLKREIDKKDKTLNNLNEQLTKKDKTLNNLNEQLTKKDKTLNNLNKKLEKELNNRVKLNLKNRELLNLNYSNKILITNLVNKNKNLESQLNHRQILTKQTLINIKNKFNFSKK